jgi:hypothetical protein
MSVETSPESAEFAESAMYKSGKEPPMTRMGADVSPTGGRG